jgi:hypothetical protein
MFFFFFHEFHQNPELDGDFWLALGLLFKNHLWVVGVTPVIESLPGMHEALNPSPRAAK